LVLILVLLIFAERCSLVDGFTLVSAFTLALTFGAAEIFLVLARALVDFFARVFAGFAAFFLVIIFFADAIFLTGFAGFTNFTFMGFVLTGFLTAALTRFGEEALVPDLETDLDLVAFATTLTFTFDLVFVFLESDSLI
jgi:hypothetical protein